VSSAMELGALQHADAQSITEPGDPLEGLSDAASIPAGGWAVMRWCGWMTVWMMACWCDAAWTAMRFDMPPRELRAAG
jgi:hypothetical protein